MGYMGLFFRQSTQSCMEPFLWTYASCLLQCQIMGNALFVPLGEGLSKEGS